MEIKSLKTNTYPLIVHAPGWTNAQLSPDPDCHNKINPLWTPIVNTWRKSKIDKISRKQSKDLTIITINTYPSKKRGILEESLDKLEVPYVVLGKGLKDWKNIYKIRLYREIMNSIHTPYVMGLDNYDMLMLRDPQEAVEKFKIMDCDILFNGEIQFYPRCGFNEQTKKLYITKEWEEFQSGIAKTSWAYLNAGAWIAKTEFYRKFINECSTRNSEFLIRSGRLPEDAGYHQKLTESEQVIMHWVFKDFYPRAQIDYENSIFFNIVGLPKFGGYVRINRHFYEIPLSEWVQILSSILKITLSLFLHIIWLIRDFLGFRECQRVIKK